MPAWRPRHQSDRRLGPRAAAQPERIGRPPLAGAEGGRHPVVMSFIERNKSIVTDLIERCINGHDPSAVHEFTTNPRVVEFQTGVLRSFPDLHVEVVWTVAEDDKVVSWQHIRGTHLGPWMFAPLPTERTVDTDVVVVFQFDDRGQIVDQWFCTNFVRMVEQLGGHVIAPSGTG